MRALPRLHAITDDARLADARFLDDAAAVLEAGGRELALHLRGRRTAAARLYELALELKPRARAAGASLLINDRVDVALVAVADGVQLREDSIDVASARAILGADALVGVSRHVASLDAEAGADFIVFGAVYPTDSHADRAAAGIDALRRAASVVGRRASGSGVALVAIGGITPDRVSEVLSAGAHGVAALSGIWNGGAKAVGEYLAALSGSVHRGPTPDSGRR